MFDIHCHLLPGIDDGPRTMPDAIALARALVDDGVTHVMATPHVFPGVWENRRSTIGTVHTQLIEQLWLAGIDLDVRWAGEVRLTDEVLGLLERDELPFLGVHKGFRLMLLEMPDALIPMGAERFCSELFRRQVRPVIVHPERNKAIMENPARLQPFVEAGCYVQVTAGSVIGQFGARAQAAAIYMLKRRWVSAVASDAHNLSGRRPRMGAARAWLTEHLGEKEARRLTWGGPQAMCARPETVDLVIDG